MFHTKLFRRGAALRGRRSVSLVRTDLWEIRNLKLLSWRAPAAFPIWTLWAGAIEMDLRRSVVTIHGKPVKLTAKEFQLLRELMETGGEVLRREFLLKKIWGYGKARAVDPRTIDVHIQQLRQKLGSEGAHILTVKNVGYRFEIFYNWIKFGS